MGPRSRAAGPLLLGLLAACVEPGRDFDWPSSDVAARVYLREGPNGTLVSEVMGASDILVLDGAESAYLLELRGADLQTIHPLVDVERAAEVRVESPDPDCGFGYLQAEDRVFGPLPSEAALHSVDLEAARFEPLSATARSELAARIRLALPFRSMRPRLGATVRNFGTEARVTMDGWVFDGEPRFIDPARTSESYHKIYDAQGLGPNHALVMHETAIILLPRGAAPLAHDDGLVALRRAELPSYGRDDWVFLSFVISTESSTAGLRRVIAASTAGDYLPRISRLSWLDVGVEPPSIRHVASTTVSGAVTFFAGRVDLEGRALFIARADRGTVPVSESRAILVAEPEPRLHRFVAETNAVFTHVGTTPRRDIPHLVIYEDGRILGTDLLRSGPPRFESRIPQAIGRGPASTDAILEGDDLRVVVAGEVGDYLWYDLDRDEWSRPRLVADEVSLRLPGCISSSSADLCGYATPGIELRDAVIHRSPGGELWTMQIPKVCPAVLTIDARGYLSTIPVVGQARPERTIERLRPGWTPRHKLLSTDQGELYELELE